MPNYSGVWNMRQQGQAAGQAIWMRPPGAPTGVSAVAGSAQATVTFTAPTDTGNPAGITGYRVTASPGGLTATGYSSPITVTGLTNNTAYTFTVVAQNVIGYGPASAPSGSVTPMSAGQVVFATAGSYSWVVPSDVSSVSVVGVGGGGGGGAWAGTGGGGGALAYTNNVAVTPGQSFTVVVGAGGAAGVNGGVTFVATNGNTVISARYGDAGNSGPLNSGGVGGRANYSIGAATFSGGDGGNGQYGSNYAYLGGGGGGTAGYSGNGGAGGSAGGGSNGSGGGGGGGGASYSFSTTTSRGGTGGGVGLLGQGSSGSGGVPNQNAPGGDGGAGSSGSGTSYGGGGYGGSNSSYGGPGGVGAVRIIWPGTIRQFPSTNTGDM